MVAAQSGASRSSTRREQRYSSGCRSKASSSAVVPSSRAASSYQARACPISFWAIDEKATSSSSSGAIPVHSEFRQPMISSSSASSSSFCAFTRPSQLFFEWIAVDSVVVLLELVGEVFDLADLVPGHDPEGHGLAPATILLARIGLGEFPVRRLHRAGVREGLALALLAEDLVDQAASASSARRTHSVSSRVERRSSSRSAVLGPWPV